MGFGPRGSCGQKRLGASRRRGHLNGSTVHQGPFASLPVFPPVCSPRRPAVPRNSSPGSEEEDPTPVLGPRIPRSLAAAPALPPSLSRAPFHHCLFGFGPTGLRADACTCHTLSGHRDFAGAASGRLCSFSFALVAVTWSSAISSKVISFLFIPF